MSEDGYIEHIKWLIEMPNGRYLCHSGSRNAVIYDRHTDAKTLAYDLDMTNGTLVPLDKPRWYEIYTSKNYTNPQTHERYVEDFYEEYVAMLSKDRQYGGSS